MTVAVADLQDITIDNDQEGASVGLTGVLGVPEGTGPWPIVVVVHEAFGIDAEMRKQVAHLASLGYLALMPDLFTEGGMRKCIFVTMRSMRSGTGRAYADIEAARQWLLKRDDSTGSVGVIGFCMGGGFALMTAAGRGFDAASANYGMLPTDMEAAFENACPVVGTYGGKDGSLKGATAKLETALTKQGVTHDLKEYPDAGHAFLNELPTGPAGSARSRKSCTSAPTPRLPSTRGLASTRSSRSTSFREEVAPGRAQSVRSPAATSWSERPAPSGAPNHGTLDAAPDSATVLRPPASTASLGESCLIAMAATFSGWAAANSA